MNELKTAITNKIGDTSKHKQHVWNKMQQRPRKTWKPLLVTISFAVVCLLFLGTSGIWGNNPEVALEEVNTITETNSQIAENTSSTIQYTILQFKPKNYPNYPPNTIGSSAVFIAENEQQLREFSSIFKLSEEEVDFSQSNVVIVDFLSDGCGREVESLSYKQGKLSIHLAYPKELQQTKEFACTAQAIPNTAMLLVPKLEKITEADIINGNSIKSATINHFKLIE